MALTHTQCKSFKPKSKPYKISDGQGLYLQVMPNGSKYWRMKYHFAGKEKLLSIGVFPMISLQEAREHRIRAKKLLFEHKDPSLHKKKAKRRAMMNADNTLMSIALEWHGLQKERWSPHHAQTVLSRLEKNIFPFLGGEPLADITTPDVLYVLRKIEQRGSYEVCRRVGQICAQVFRYGVQTGKCGHNPARDLQGALRTRKTRHFPSIEPKHLPELLSTIRTNDARLFGRTRRAIMLSMLTFVRPGELRQARWEDIDLEVAQWIIPARFMKMDRPHIVPLADQAADILIEQQKETEHMNTPWVFPSQVRPGKAMSDGTVNVALKKLGFDKKMTAHGFRALARTAIREKLDYAPDIIEAQLAHKATGALGEAYNRAQFLTQRKIMMQDWANYIDRCGGG